MSGSNNDAIGTTPATTTGNGGVNIPVVVAVCIGVVVVIAIIIAVIYFRCCRHNASEWSPNEAVAKDEEEVLLHAGLPQKREKSNNDATGSKETRTVKDKHQSQLPDDNDATPMLISMQHHEPDNKTDLTDFNRKLEDLPMIDSGKDISDTENVNTLPQNDTATNTNNDDTIDVSKNNQDHNLLHNNSSTADTIPNTEEEESTENKEKNTLDTGVDEDEPPYPLPTDLSVKLRESINPNREVLTESRVLAMLDDGQESCGDVSFSSLPEDNHPALDFKVTADVHHRLISFDGGIDKDIHINDAKPRVPLNAQTDYFRNDNATKPDQNEKNISQTLVNGTSDSNGNAIQDSRLKPNENLCIITEDNACYNNKVNGIHEAKKTNKTDTIKNHSPSVVVDHSLNEITVHPKV